MTLENPEQKVQELERKTEILKQLAEISTVLTSRLQLDTLLDHIMDVAVSITDSEAASVLLWNSNTRELFFAASTSASAHDLLNKPVPMDSIAGTILRENRTVMVDNAKSDPRHYSKLDEEIEFVTRSLLGVPMVYKDRRIGVLEAINKRSLPWTEEDVQYLSILAAQAAVAIEDAQMMMELRRANDELHQLEKLKDDFIAIASHELRTPLGVILGYASFLQEESSEEAREHASKVVGSALQLRGIIEDMINLRYLKQKQSDLVRSSLPVQDILRDAERDVFSLLDTGLHTLEIIEPPLELCAYADRSRIAMAMTSLLNNAIRFTPQGGRISISSRTEKDEVWIQVSDTGIGLEADQLERIFEEFYQVEDHMIRKYGGLGIGLSITRAIVTAHGGRIWAESPGLGQGSTFTFTLPLAE